MKEQLAVPQAEFRSYYGRPILKKPAWDWKIAAYLFSGGLSAGSAMLGAGADLTGRPGLRRVSRVGSLVEHRGEPVLPGCGFGSAGAVPSHAAGGEAELADEHGHVDPVGVRAGRGSGRGGGVDAAGVAPDVAGPAGGVVGEAGGAVGSGDGAGGGVVYGSSVVADGGSGVAGGPPVSAVRVHGLGGGERRRAGHAAGAGRRDGPGAADGGAGAGLEVAASRVMEQRLGLSCGGVHDGQGPPAAQWSECLTVGGALGAAWVAVVGRWWRRRGWRCWRAARCRGSGCSRLEWSRRGTRSMWWCRSGNGWTRVALPVSSRFGSTASGRAVGSLTPGV